MLTHGYQKCGGFCAFIVRLFIVHFPENPKENPLKKCINEISSFYHHLLSLSVGVFVGAGVCLCVGKSFCTEF